jgi:HK97 family phage major capsid protein
MSIQALREQRAAKAKSLHELVNKKDWKPERISPSTTPAWPRSTRSTPRSSNITDGQRAPGRRSADRTRRRRRRRQQGPEVAGARVFAKWLRNGGDDGLSAEDRAIYNTMSTTTNSQGGYTVQTEVARRCSTPEGVRRMRKVANVIQTSGVGDLQLSDLGRHGGSGRDHRPEHHGHGA